VTQDHGAGAPTALRRLREANAAAVLDVVWGSAPVTGSDVMAVTGLSRATTHDVCEELIELGWVREVENQREHGDYRKGRPARRYGFDGRGRVVAGVDAGEHRISATVTDLHGEVLGHEEVVASSRRATAAGRLESIATTVRAALHDAAVPEAHLLAVAVGVPAPVDAAGLTPARGNDFWARMNPDLGGQLTAAHGWTVLVDNDANLAALAEGWRGHGRGVRSYVTLLAGERFGAGVVEDGTLVRGARGGAGEMRFLDLVEGVGSADGIAARARDGARRALAGSTRPSVLRGPAAPEAEDVFAAARAGDELALDVLAAVGDVTARVVATLASAFDTERVVVAGAVAASAEPVLATALQRLPRYFDPPVPQVHASELGVDVVTVGAVRRALDHVRATAVTTDLHDEPEPLALGG